MHQKEDSNIDILMPIHNGEKYLSESLQSILQQTDGNWRLVVVLDRCTDESENILRQIIPIEKLLLVSQNSGSLGEKLNFGLEYATSELVMRFDCDDVMHPQRIEIQRRFFMNNPKISVVGSGLTVIDENGEILGITRLPVSPIELRRSLIVKCTIMHPSVMYKRSDVLSVGGYTTAIDAEDWELWMRMAIAGFSFANLEETLVAYRVHSEQTSRKRIAGSSLRTIQSSQIKLARYCQSSFLGIFSAVNLALQMSQSKRLRRISQKIQPQLMRRLEMSSVNPTFS